MKVLSYKDAAYARFVKNLDRRATPGGAGKNIEDIVASIIADVQKRGNAAVLEYTQKFDGLKLTNKSLFVSQGGDRGSLRNWLTRMSKKPSPSANAISMPSPNAACARTGRQKIRKVSRSANASPPMTGSASTSQAAKAPLVSTALMTAAFGQAAGVPQILAASPAGPDGKLNPALLYALVESGATEIIKVGGAQAIAAMALGTKSIAPVEKIFGPGNVFVVEAKRQLVGAVSIDLLPGPSEVLIVADKSANAKFIAADMLAQAEHGGDSVVGFATNSKRLLSSSRKRNPEAGLYPFEGEIPPRRAQKRHLLPTHPKLCKKPSTSATPSLPSTSHSSSKTRTSGWVKSAPQGAIYVGPLAAVAVGDFLAGPATPCPQAALVNPSPVCVPISSNAAPALCAWIKKRSKNPYPRSRPSPRRGPRRPRAFRQYPGGINLQPDEDEPLSPMRAVGHPALHRSGHRWSPLCLPTPWSNFS